MSHARVLEGEPKALAQWATRVGPKTTAMLRHHLEHRSDLTNGLKAARRLRDLARLHGEERFEAVCGYALPLNITALRSIESILRNGADKLHRAAAPRTAPAHEHVRGASYFGEV